MPECAVCHGPLTRQTTEHGIVYACPRCRGRAVSLSVLRKAGAGRGFLPNLWQKARDESAPLVRPCPHCTSRIPQVTADVGGESIQLDVCRRCLSVWFDASEYEPLLETFPGQAPGKRELPAEARRRLAIAKVERMGREASGDQETPEHAWQWLPAVLGLPVELDAPRVGRLPWVTYATVLACVAATACVFLGAGRGAALEDVFKRWGFVPARWTRAGGLTLLSAMFLHGGVMHLLGNMYFLYVFGDNTEDRLGWKAYSLLLLAAHFGGMLLHGLLTPHPQRPCVGASAAISGVIAFYGVTYPRVNLGFMFRIYLYFRWVRIPAVVAFALYFVLQIIGAHYQIAGLGNVSYLAHLGGVAVGLAAASLAHVHRERFREKVLDRLDTGLR